MCIRDRDKIEHFQKEAFYKVALTDGRLTVVSENIANEEAADLLASLCMDSEAEMCIRDSCTDCRYDYHICTLL